MSATPDTSITSDVHHDSGRPRNDVPTQTSIVAQFQLALSIYAGWSALVWLSSFAGTTTIAPQAVTILLIGIGATNALFFIIARSHVLHRPPVETIALAQAVVGIAWTTLFAFMSTGAGELIIGIYASIVVFALLRVSRGALNQITIFAVISYSVASLVKALSAETVELTAGTLVQVLSFAGIMLCLSAAGGHVYRWHHRLMSELGELRSNVIREFTSSGTNSVNRRYILELLDREKGRTDRSNVPFCVCVFTLDHIVTPLDGTDENVRTHLIKTAEVTIRQELRDMDSLNPTGFHECFGPYSDKEYVAILPQTNLHGAQHATERVLTAVTAQRESTDELIKLCGGIAEYHRGESISTLLARAQDALGEARATGVSHICATHSDRGQDPDSERHEAHQATVVRLDTRRR